MTGMIEDLTATALRFSPFNNNNGTARHRDVPYSFSFVDMRNVSFSGTIMLICLMVFLLFGIATTVCFSFVRWFWKRMKQRHTTESINEQGLLTSYHLSAYTAPRRYPIFRAFLSFWVLLWLWFSPFSILSAFSSLPVSVSIAIQILGSLLILSHQFLRVDSRKQRHIEASKYPFESIMNGDESTEAKRLLDTPSNIEKSSSLPGTICDYYWDCYYGVKHRFLVAIAIILFSISLPTLIVLPTCSLCITVRPFTMSSAASRILFPHSTLTSREAVCKLNTICHIYFTVPQDMSTSMIINFHSYSRQPVEAFVMVRRDGPDTIPVRYNATFFRMNNIPVQERYQYWADVTHLVPNTTYIVEQVSIVMRHGKRRWLVEHGRQALPLKFRTGPGANSKDPVSFVAGGDMEWGSAGISLSKYAAKKNILFAIVGGDIAYENAIAACFMRYDEWFYNWNKHMVTPEGYSIPILTAIGNHEAGGWRKRRSYVPFYFHYFPHEIGLQKVKPSERLAYHQHVFAQHTTITVLDSFVVTPILGLQQQWLETTLQNSTADQINRIVVYHASVFPAHKTEIRDITSQIQNHYVPLFEKYDVKIALENHYHCLVDSHPIRNGKIDPVKGVHYLGQGGWGVPPRKTIDKGWWVRDAASVENIHHCECSNNGCQVQTLEYRKRDKKTEVRSSIHVQ